MNPFSNIVQKAFYLGMGLASVAGEKAGSTLNELRTQATKLAEELVERGEMSTDEAKKFVDDLIRQSQKSQDQIKQDQAGTNKSAPRTINIDDGTDSENLDFNAGKNAGQNAGQNNDKDNTQNQEAKDLEAMRAKVQKLQDQLRKIQQ